MSTPTIILSDHDLQTSVRDELDWAPEVDSPAIGVAVSGGTVTLSGEVEDYSKLLSTKRAALRVHGVSTVVDELTIRVCESTMLTETDIAKEVEHALAWAANVPDSVQAEVARHHVSLTGEVQWDYERQAAGRAVQHLRGVDAVENRITLIARPSAVDMAERIRNALVRNAQLDANHLTVLATGTKITLSGDVSSWAEKKQAGLAAWSSPHVTEVDNQIEIRAF